MKRKSILEKIQKLILKKAIDREMGILSEIERLGITTKEAIANYHLELYTSGSSRLVLNNPMEKKDD